VAERGSDARMGTLQRARSALTGGDYRRLLAIRLVGGCGDGFLQAALVASVVFAPSEQSTTVGLFKAGLITALPFTIVGPFVGVFLDRWPRRAVLALAPLAKAAAVTLVLFDPQTATFPFYAGALLVLSINRFYLAGASAVVPRLVPAADLLTANGMATVGGTLALLTGVFVGGKVADAAGSSLPVVIVAATTWLVSSFIATRIRSPLAPMTLPPPPELLRHEVRRVLRDMVDGGSALVRTPRAIGPITSITVDQVGQGIILTLALVLFRDELGEGVGSFSNLIGAGGVGVLIGIATVGWLEDHLPKERIVSLGFVVGGIALLGAAIILTATAFLVTSAIVGLSFAWKKIPTDTLVQRSLPDGYRGRVFAVYDVAYNSARTVAAGLAIPMFPAFGIRWSVTIVAAVFLLWAPVLPRWLRDRREIELRFHQAGHGGSTPVAVRWGAAEEQVTVVRSSLDERDGERRRRFRLQLGDGTELDVSSPEPRGEWRIDRERDDPM